MNKVVQKVTERIIERSKAHREPYLLHLEQARGKEPFRHGLSSSNLAHGLAVSTENEKRRLLDHHTPNIAIISAYNDMLSAHHPFKDYPAIIKEAVAAAGGVAQVAGGVPAMCDGVTQGEAGMDLSLISRDVIAMSTVIALSHNLFEGAVLLGMCDKILPGMLMGALQFGHLPFIMIPAGPMISGISNREKAKARERYVRGEISKETLLHDYECKIYHGDGICTFYGTANSNQMIAEVLGLHLPGATFIHPGSPLREALTRAASATVCSLTHLGGNYIPIGHVVNEKSVVNAIVAWLATGGSTNETLHLVAIARAAGIRINWDDFSDLSDAVPQLVSIYPNGPGDINSFQEAGGTALLIRELLQSGHLHSDVLTVAGPGLGRYTQKPKLENSRLVWSEGPETSVDRNVIRPADQPFAATGGTRILSGNLGRAVIKISALTDGVDTVVEAPAMVFNSQHELAEAFNADELNRDLIAVFRFQGPRAIGMPELHNLITYLSVIMERGFTVGLVTDGRLSGASGKVPSAIHLTPEAVRQGPLAKVRDGDIIRIDVRAKRLELKVSDRELESREYAPFDLSSHKFGMGRQIFAPLRKDLSGAEEGASSIYTYGDEIIRVSAPEKEKP
jgi:phosphogluconate dehydratase